MIYQGDSSEGLNTKRPLLTFSKIMLGIYDKIVTRHITFNFYKVTQLLMTTRPPKTAAQLFYSTDEDLFGSLAKPFLVFEDGFDPALLNGIYPSFVLIVLPIGQAIPDDPRSAFTWLCRRDPCESPTRIK